MLHIDSFNNLALNLDDIRRMSSAQVSDMDALEKFAKGVHLDDEFIFNDRWGGQPLRDGQDIFRLVLHEMLPTVYDASYLKKIGGSVSFRVTGIGDFTMAEVSGRVVTFSGATTDFETGAEVFDFEIASDVFLGFCRGLLLEMAGDILEDDDEWEDRIISDGELVLNGMPSGGKDAIVDETIFTDDKLASTINTVLENKNMPVGTVDQEGFASGRISFHSSERTRHMPYTKHDRDFFAVHFKKDETYTIDLMGSSSGKGTLYNPNIYGVYDQRGRSLFRQLSSDIGGKGRDDLREFTANYDGVHYIEVGAPFYYAGNTGTYQLEVQGGTLRVRGKRVNEMLLGEDFASTISSALSGTTAVGTVNREGFARGDASSAMDRDFFAVKLRKGETYAIDARGKLSGQGTASHPYLRGIYSHTGTLLRWGNEGGGLGGQESRFEFTAQWDGTYYIEAAAWRGGTYQLEVKNTTPSVRGAYSDELLLGGDLASTISAARDRHVPVGTVNEEGFAAGLVNRAKDRDFFAVNLKTGVKYTIDLKGKPSKRGLLTDPRLHGVYDKNGRKVHQGNDDISLYHNRESYHTYTARYSGVHYIKAGAYGRNTGSYQLEVRGNDGIRVRSGHVNEIIVDKEFTSSVTRARAVIDRHSLRHYFGTLNREGAGAGKVLKAGDRDVFAFNLQKGAKYQMDLRGKHFSKGSLKDPRIYGLFDKHGKKLHSGNDDVKSGVLDSQLLYHARYSGVHYIKAGAYGSNTGSYQLTVKEIPVLTVKSSGRYLFMLNESSRRIPSGDFKITPSRHYAGTVDDEGIGRGRIHNTYGRQPDDKDMFGVYLKEGQRYTIHLKGRESGRGSLKDPRLYGVYDKKLKRLHKGDDDGGKGLESYHTFTAQYTGTHYIEAGGYTRGRLRHFGTYELHVNADLSSGVVVAGGAAGETLGSSCNGNTSVNWMSTCGIATSGIGYSLGASSQVACGVLAFGCGANISAIGKGARGVFVFGCGLNAFLTGSSACGADLYGCGINATVVGASICGAAAFGCGANGVILGANICGADAYGCAVNAIMAGVSACGANASACAVNAGLGLVTGCGANATVCGAKVGNFCAAKAVGCGVDVSFGVDVGACAINILPVLPSC